MQIRTPQIECYDERDRLIPLADAIHRVVERTPRIPATEVAGVAELAGRICALDLHSAIDIPPHANAAMDGYAVDSQALSAASGDPKLRIHGRAMAGQPWPLALAPGETIRIMTGAVVPRGVDAVIAQENVRVEDGYAVLLAKVRPGDNIRRPGEDIREGQVVVSKGVQFTPAHVGVVASTGLAGAEVFRKPKVVIYSTGNELRQPGQSLKPGQIYDSNRFMLIGMLSRMAVDVDDGGVLADDETALRETLTRSAVRYDAIITSGGASTGEADYIAGAVRERGDLAVWRIALRPGRPFAHGTIGDCAFFGLPGNPVAVAVTFYQIVQPALRHMMGASDLTPYPLIKVPSRSKFKKKPNRTEAFRSMLEYDDNGELGVAITGKQGSGILTSMAAANCLVILDHDDDSADVGDWVTVQPFFGLTSG